MFKDFAAPQQLGWTTARGRRPRGLHYAIEDPEISPDCELEDFSVLRAVLAQL